MGPRESSIFLRFQVPNPRLVVSSGAVVARGPDASCLRHCRQDTCASMQGVVDMLTLLTVYCCQVTTESLTCQVRVVLTSDVALQCRALLTWVRVVVTSDGTLTGTGHGDGDREGDGLSHTRWPRQKCWMHICHRLNCHIAILGTCLQEFPAPCHVYQTTDVRGVKHKRRSSIKHSLWSTKHYGDVSK
jgi:hypothetical protein